MKKLPGLFLIYGVIIACFCLTFGAGMFVLTVEPDEVWNLMSTMKAFGVPPPLTSAVDNPVTTTGGLHFILHGLIAQGWSGNIIAHRLASLGVTLILLGVVFKVLESQIKDRILAVAGTALFATAPGFLLQASLATSEIVATLAFLLAVLFWVKVGSRSPSMALLGGVLFGLACATRMTCLSMLPAILLWSVFAQRGWVVRYIYPLIAIVMAVLVFVAFLAIYFYAFGDATWSQYMAANSVATGLGRPFQGVMMRLNYLAVGEGIIPMLAIVALGGWFTSQLTTTGEDDGKIIRFCGFLLLAGGAGWLAWVLRAPIPHIRYLWPAIPLLWLAAILLGLTALSRARREGTVMLAHWAIILICAFQGLLNVRMLAVGDSLTLVYEVARSTKLGLPDKDVFAARRNQNEMAALLANLPASANIYALVEPTAYPMTYISSRTVKSLLKMNKANLEDYVLVQPIDHSVWLPKWETIGWLQNNATLLARQGEYELYHVHEGALRPAQ